MTGDLEMFEVEKAARKMCKIGQGNKKRWYNKREK